MRIPNFNNQMTIYPSDKGWSKIKKILMKKYDYDEFEADNYINNHTTHDFGYKDIAWSVIDDLHKLFFHSSTYLETTDFELTDIS